MKIGRVSEIKSSKIKDWKNDSMLKLENLWLGSGKLTMTKSWDHEISVYPPNSKQDTIAKPSFTNFVVKTHGVTAIPYPKFVVRSCNLPQNRPEYNCAVILAVPLSLHEVSRPLMRISEFFFLHMEFWGFLSRIFENHFIKRDNNCSKKKKIIKKNERLTHQHKVCCKIENLSTRLHCALEPETHEN